MFARFAVIVGLLALAVAYSARSSISAGHEQSYVVRYGDTLWSIAASHYGGDTREAIWNLQDRNHLHGTIVRPGQRLILP